MELDLDVLQELPAQEELATDCQITICRMTLHGCSTSEL
jgi:hypothetical protein